MDGHEGDSNARTTAPETTAPDPEGSTRPVEWDRHQMETDDAGETVEGGGAADPKRGADTLDPKWNKGEVAEEREDHTRDPLPAPAEPAGGLSGGGSNPGGGEQWAERDRER
jgi:hypothetical protein